MDPEFDSRKIVPIRTFAQDAARMKGAQKSAPLPSPALSPKEIEKPESMQETAAKPAAVLKAPKLKLKKEPPHTAPARPLVTPAEISSELRKMPSQKTSPFTAAEDGALDVETGNSGSIIRDTKRKRFKLLPAIAEATKDWADERKSAWQKRAEEGQHYIEKADARKEIIAAAVREDTTAPREDFGTVAEHLKQVKRQEVTTGITLKDKEDVPSPSWSYVNEEQQRDSVSEGAEQPEALQEKEEMQHAEGAVSEPPALPHTEAPEEPVIAPEAAAFAPVLEEETPAAAKIEPDPLPVKAVPKTQAAPARQYRRPAAPVAGQGFPTYMLIGVITLSVALGVGASYFLLKGDEPALQKTVAHKVPALLRVSTFPFVLEGSREALLGMLLSQASLNSGAVLWYATIPDADASQVPASAEEVLNAFAFRMSGTFTRSIMEIAFGAGDTEPYIVMKVTGFDTAFAGMLEWERSMSADLSPLFGPTVVETFDSSARTDTQVREAFFKDVIASNKNARLLLDETGKERIIYTFIDQQTIIITTTKGALERLVPLFP